MLFLALCFFFFFFLSQCPRNVFVYKIFSVFFITTTPTAAATNFLIPQWISDYFIVCPDCSSQSMGDEGKNCLLTHSLIHTCASMWAFEFGCVDESIGSIMLFCCFLISILFGKCVCDYVWQKRKTIKPLHAFIDAQAMDKWMNINREKYEQIDVTESEHSSVLYICGMQHGLV